MQEAEEGLGGFVVTGGDAMERLEAVQHTLDAFAVPVSQDTACNRLKAIGPRQDAVDEQALAPALDEQQRSNDTPLLVCQNASRPSAKTNLGSLFVNRL